jgi:iron complex outermembrane receptor protein
MNSIQAEVPPGDPYPTAADLAENPNASVDDIIGAIIFFEAHEGSWENYGLFTEENFKLSDVFRITAGLRYDKTDIIETKTFTINDNLNDAQNSLKPEIWVVGSHTDRPTFHNITYKLRFEYDLSPDHMVYALTSTGFMPGQSGASPMFGPRPDGSFGLVGFQVLALQEKKLTAYEIGSKSELFDNTFRLNSDVYYYEYEGYQEAVNITEGQPGPPFFTLVSVPLKMMGAEVSAQWLITERDRMTMNLGALSSEIDHHVDIPNIGSTEQFMMLRHVTGHPPMQFTLSYDHSFLFNSGAVLVPRVQLRYNKGYYLGQITEYGFNSLTAAGYNPYLYDYQDDYVVTDINFTWTSADGNYSLTGYFRNALDERYKRTVGFPRVSGPPDNPTLGPSSVGVGDPRAWGLVFRARF